MDVLGLYAEAPDPKRPVVCFDEFTIHKARTKMGLAYPRETDHCAGMLFLRFPEPPLGPRSAPRWGCNSVID
jgi:hypothetical protein